MTATPPPSVSRLNDDFDRRVVAHAADARWLPSPQPGVERRMLDRVGREIGRATSIVRYAAGGEIEVGYVAQSHQASDPRNTVVSAKRFMGRGRKDIAMSKCCPTISSTPKAWSS